MTARSPCIARRATRRARSTGCWRSWSASPASGSGCSRRRHDADPRALRALVAVAALRGSRHRRRRLVVAPVLARQPARRRERRRRLARTTVVVVAAHLAGGDPVVAPERLGELRRLAIADCCGDAADRPTVVEQHVAGAFHADGGEVRPEAALA